MYDPKYKVKHRVTSARRLLKYEHLPPPMVDDPADARSRDWDYRCRAVYNFTMLIKRGFTPPSMQRGLWFHDWRASSVS